MIKRLVLACVLSGLVCRPALAHEIGFGEQVLQPVTVFHSLLAILAVGLLFRQQPSFAFDKRLAIAMGIGLTVGLAVKVLFNPSQIELMFAAGLAALAGSLVAMSRPLPEVFLSILAPALGIAIGSNLSFESTDLYDLTQTLLGACAGSLVALYLLTTTPGPTEKAWYQIGLRILGSWLCACAMMILALDMRNLI